MYESYWNLSSKPFENTTNSRFYYPSADHQAALLKIRYAIESRHSAAMLSGASGVGKTLLLQCLAAQLPEQCSPFVHIVFPQMPHQQLLMYLTDRLCGRMEGEQSVHHAWQRLEEFLVHNTEQGGHAVIVIDEAHLLGDSDALETMRLVTNVQCEGKSTSTLVFAGLPSLLSTLDRMPEFEERFTVKCILPRLSVDETEFYIEHRLQAAGATGRIFDGDAIQTIHALSHGSPRRINRLCDLAMLVAFAEERSVIGTSQIEEVADELAPVSN